MDPAKLSFWSRFQCLDQLVVRWNCHLQPSIHGWAETDYWLPFCADHCAYTCRVTLLSQITQKYFALWQFGSKSVAAIMTCVHMCLPFWYQKVKKNILKFTNVIESDSKLQERNCTMTSNTFKSGRSMPWIYALHYVLSSQNSILNQNCECHLTNWCITCALTLRSSNRSCVFREL